MHVTPGQQNPPSFQSVFLKRKSDCINPHLKSSCSEDTTQHPQPPGESATSARPAHKHLPNLVSSPTTQAHPTRLVITLLLPLCLFILPSRMLSSSWRIPTQRLKLSPQAFLLGLLPDCTRPLLGPLRKSPSAFLCSCNKEGKGKAAGENHGPQ